jgi:hypothetical protein
LLKGEGPAHIEATAHDNGCPDSGQQPAGADDGRGISDSRW